MIGTWVKQYRAGYWFVVDIKPKFADSDYSGDETSWKKGDRIGSWALLKKGFTGKMRFSMDSDYCDSAWLKPVSEEEQFAIDHFFSEHPEQKAKFESFPYSPHPGIVNMWIILPLESESRFRHSLNELSPRFSVKEVSTLMEANHAAISVPGEANYLLNLSFLPWELTEEFDPLFNGFELEPVL